MTSYEVFYKKELKNYYQLLNGLFTILSDQIVVEQADSTNLNFPLLYTNIAEQIRNWPKDEFLLPPVAWIKPRTGTIDFNQENWKFAFHGGGISFISSKTDQDISGEFAQSGDLGITEYTTLLYFETCPPKQLPKKELIEHHSEWFKQLVQDSQLMEIPSLLPYDDQVYYMSSSFEV